MIDAEKVEKENLKKEEVTCGTKKKDLETKVQQMKKKRSKIQDEEEKATEKFGKARDVNNVIEKKTLRRYRAQATTHHGGDLERNSIRRMTCKGDEMFSEIADFLCKLNDENKIGN